LQGFTRFLVGGDDENCIVTGDGSGNFGKFCAVHGCSEGLRAARRGFQNQQIFRGPDIEKKFAERARQRRQGRGLVGESGAGTIAGRSLNEAELLEVA
jgi:hypothetical protein